MAVWEEFYSSERSTQMIRTFLTSAIVAFAAILATSESAHAQRISVRIGGSPGYYGGPGYYGRGGSGISIGVYPSSSIYGPGYYGGPAYLYGPRYVPYPVYVEPRIVYTPLPVIVVPQAPPSVPASTTTYVRVLLPDANARVWFDGNATTSTGPERLYHAPTITAGTSGTYRVRASWKQNGQEMVQEQVVNVNAGRTATVDFTQPVDPFDAPQPNPAK
jgi:uncharacterized protein (TIGR03000 family)